MFGFVHWIASIQRRRTRLVKSYSRGVVRLRGKRLRAGVGEYAHRASIRAGVQVQSPVTRSEELCNFAAIPQGLYVFSNIWKRI